MAGDSRAPAPVRLVYLTIGWLAVGCAFAGVLLPGVPTTVFVIIASYCFSMSSPRFSRWLRENRWLGPSLRRHTAGGMSRTAKRAALAAMWTSVAVSTVLLAALSLAAALGTVALACIGTLWIVFRVRTIGDRPHEA
jgi:hypothetical protein